MTLAICATSLHHGFLICKGPGQQWPQLIVHWHRERRRHLRSTQDRHLAHSRSLVIVTSPPQRLCFGCRYWFNIFLCLYLHVLILGLKFPEDQIKAELFSVHSAGAQFGICSQWLLNCCRMIYIICKHIKVPKPHCSSSFTTSNDKDSKEYRR